MSLTGLREAPQVHCSAQYQAAETNVEQRSDSRVKAQSPGVLHPASSDYASTGASDVLPHPHENRGPAELLAAERS